MHVLYWWRLHSSIALTACAGTAPAPLPHPASTINLDAAPSPKPPKPSGTGAAASSPGQGAPQQEPAVKGGIAQAKGGTLTMHGRAVSAAEHTLERLQHCLGALLPLQVEIPTIEA